MVTLTHIKLHMSTACFKGPSLNGMDAVYGMTTCYC